MIVLGLESTCDETACAIVEAGKTVLGQVVSTQIDLHNTFGGVVPELACRRHIEVIMPVIQEAIDQAGITLADVDLIAAARGPGLIGAILIGLTTGKALSYALDRPFVGVNHVEAHLYAAIMSHDAPPPLPALGVVISGGHTALLIIHDVGSYTLLGQTRDDAVGEAFDKVAKIMGLPYPGGPAIEALAREGDPSRYNFRPARLKDDRYGFSFSGLKTKVLYTVKGQNAQPDGPVTLAEGDRADVAASFQEAALGDIVTKAGLALKEHQLQSVIVGGGVANNKRLRQLFKESNIEIPVLWPAPDLTLDNAAMIAGLGYHRFRLQGGSDDLNLEAQARIPDWG